MPGLNYATQYGNQLVQEYPRVLNFGDLYRTPNNGRFRWINGNTIEIPSIKVGGRVNGSRDTIGAKKRNFDNEWEPKKLRNHRTWSTLVHPRDIDETNQVVSITNITRVMNEEEKFPEMDAYTISTLYTDWTALERAADQTVLTVDNVLSVFDKLMKNMTKKRVSPNGRILYVTPDVDDLIKNAKEIYHTMSVQGGSQVLNRDIKSLDNVKKVVVPPELMLTAYNFTEGWKAGSHPAQIKMFLVDPKAVITPVSYEFAKLDEPSAGSEGKWDYFEESFEDVFILNKRADGLQFVTSAELETDVSPEAA